MSNNRRTSTEEKLDIQQMLMFVILTLGLLLYCADIPIDSVLVLVAGVYFIAMKQRRKTIKKNGVTFAVQGHRTASEIQKTSQQMLQTKGHTSNLNAHQEFPEPEAYCVTCDQNGTDHFESDKALRLKQLDQWLKSGLIDSAEYKKLKARYIADETPH